MMPKVLWEVRSTALITLLLVLTLCSYFFLKDYQSELSPGFDVTALDEQDPVFHRSSCRLDHNPCPVKIENLPITIELKPGGLPALVPLVLSIRSDLIERENTLIWFDGKDMDMGRHFFQPALRATSNSSLSFEGMIPVCTVDANMIWSLHIRARLNDALHEIIFEIPAGEHSQDT